MLHTPATLHLHWILSSRLPVQVGEQQNGLLCPVCKGGDSGEKSLSLCIQEATFATWHCFRSNKCGYEGAVSSEIPLDDGDLPELPGT